MTDANLAVAFLRDLFGEVTSHPVFICSLPNSDARERERGEQRMMTGDKPGGVEKFVERWDQRDRGMFFCVATLKPDAIADRPGGSPRSKANVSEMSMLHADVDAKDIALPLEEALGRILALPIPPSVVVRSGRGLHCYWLLREAYGPEEMDRIEAALRQITDLVGGDQASAEASRLMRLPGTHNSKDGAWTPVDITHADWRRHELTDLEDMLGWLSPCVPRLTRETPANSEANPFLAIARQLGFKPPVDVEARLDAMAYQGPGEAAIHSTQLSVSASLLRQGVGVEEVVDILLGATKAAAGEYGSRWNWAREEKALRRMCEDWLKKHPVSDTLLEQGVTLPAFLPRKEGQKPDTLLEQGVTLPEAAVVNLGAERAKRQPKPPPGKKVPLHVVIGHAVLETIRARGEDLIVTGIEARRYRDGLWSEPLSDVAAKRWLDAEIEAACAGLSIPSAIKIRNEARSWMFAQPGVYFAEVAWDTHGKIPTRSGLVDPLTGAITAPTPAHRATWRIECDYDPDARCPHWERMLDDAFADREPAPRAATVGMLQEVLGTALVEVRAKALKRALVLVGGANSGKTSILDVMGGLLSDHPISVPFEQLAKNHGLMEFRRRAPWVLHEAFSAGKWHDSQTVKNILTGEPVHIDVKNGPMITQSVYAPAFWGSNQPISFREPTGAIAARVLSVPCRVTFEPGKLVGTALAAHEAGFPEPAAFVLDREKPGLLNWALVGLRRALAQLRISEPEEVKEELDRVREDSNFALGFVREFCKFAPDGMVSVPDFCAAFSVWWTENKGEDRHVPSNESIGRVLAALGDPRIATDSKEIRDNSRRYYAGIGLNEAGLEFWNGAKSEGMARGKTARVSAGADEVNKAIPGSWDERAAVVRMRAAQAASKAAERASLALAEEALDQGLLSETPGDSDGDSRGDSMVTDEHYPTHF